MQLDLWPKYLQAGLNEMYYELKHIKESIIQLDSSEFAELPVTHLKSLDDYKLFEDYLASDIMIEIARFLKYQLMTLV